MRIVYILFTIKAWIISIMPFWLLYRVSDFIRFVLYYIIGYRKNVVFENLRNAFPDKDEKELRKIARKYYRNLGDVIVEVIKTQNISLKQFISRAQFENLEIIHKLFDENRSIIATIGHCGNWEWIPRILQTHIKHKGFAAVKPLSDKFFDQYMTRLRFKHVTYEGGGVIPFKQTLKVLLQNKHLPTFMVLASDQTPHKNEINYWHTFLNQDTPFFLGTEKIAKSLNHAVIFMDIQRAKRGLYNCKIRLITDDPSGTEEFEITNTYIKYLEEAIKDNPDNWLWSHRRWKYKREPNV